MLLPLLLLVMNYRFSRSLLLLSGVFLSAYAFGDSAVLKIESSQTGADWQPVPGEQTILSPHGVEVPDDGSDRNFWRLTVENLIPGTSGAVPTEQINSLYVGLATEFLEDFTLSPEEDGVPEEEEPPAPPPAALTWVNQGEAVTLSPFARPIYNPAVPDGPAYWEFKVIKVLPPLEEQNWLPDVPDDDEEDLGFIIVSTTRNDFPITSFAVDGSTLVEQLIERAGTSNIRVVRFDSSFHAAEGPNGEILANLGQVPPIVDPSVIQLNDLVFEDQASDNEDPNPQYPEFEAEPAESYELLKEAYLNNAFFTQVRAARAAEADSVWDSYLSREEATIIAEVNTQDLYLEDLAINEATVANQQLAQVDPQVNGVIIIVGQTTGETTLTVTDAEGFTYEYSLKIVPPGTIINQGLFCGNWSNWRYFWSQRTDLQRNYGQYRNPAAASAGMCSPSGCGPTAWAMLYGYWDRRSSPRLMSSFFRRDAPLNNDLFGVLACTQSVYFKVSTVCLNFAGAAATVPWTMHRGHTWARDRGAGYSIQWRWCVPHLGGGPGSLARQAIRDGVPSIIGIGFYSHYPLAYGYAERVKRCRLFGDERERWFWCNMGWSGTRRWERDSGIWYGTRAFY